MFKIKKNFFFILILSMAIVVALSNYLVQFPINYFGLRDLLTYGAFSYPIAFLITDISNRFYGKIYAKKIVYIGFAFGICFTLLFSTNFADLISIRIAIGSGTAFIVAQLFDVQIFDQLRKKNGLLRLWFHLFLALLLILFCFSQYLLQAQVFHGLHFL